MGQAIPRQHPAVVLRSQFNFVRNLLAVAMVAVVGLTTAVVIVANDGDEVASTSSAQSAPATVQPALPDGLRYDGGPEEGTRGAQTAPLAPGTRYDGGPEEGSRGTVSAQPRVSQDQAFPGLAREAAGAQPDARRYDGGPEEGSRGRGH